MRAELLAGLPVTERRIEIAGIPTAVLEGGAGTPLVLLHGQGGFAAAWGRTLAALTATHRVVAPDLPGHGASRLPPSTLDRDHVVNWLEALIAWACDEPPVVVGHLLGGAVALHHVVAHADRLRALVLVDTLGLTRYRPSPTFALALAAFVARPTERSRDRMFRRCFADDEAVRVRVGELWAPTAGYALDRARSPELKRALRELMSTVGGALAPEQLAAIDVPTTLVHGRDDLQVRLEVAERASARFGWPLHVIDGAADDPPLEQPEAFLALLREVVAATGGEVDR